MNFHNLLVFLGTNILITTTCSYGNTISRAHYGGDFKITDYSFTSQKVVAGTGNSTSFGAAIFAAPDIVAVGFPRDANNGKGGQVFVFGRSSGVYSLGAKLFAGDGSNGNKFGSSVHGNSDNSGTTVTIVVGASGENSNRGSVYFFDVSNNYAPDGKVTASDGQPNHFFGCSVAITSATQPPPHDAYVGAYGANNKGAVYVFTKSSPNSWSQINKLVSGGLSSGSEFGFTVSLSANRLAIGAPGAVGLPTVTSGVVYVYGPVTGGWTENNFIIPNDGFNGDRFGHSLDLIGSDILIGSPNQNSDRGGGYVFKRISTYWSMIGKLLPDVPNGRFGCSSQIASGGSPVVFGSCNEGAVYIFDNRSQWAPSGKWKPTDHPEVDRFGASLFLTNNVLLSGAPAAGKVYITDLIDSPTLMPSQGPSNPTLSPSFISTAAPSVSMSPSVSMRPTFSPTLAAPTLSPIQVSTVASTNAPSISYVPTPTPSIDPTNWIVILAPNSSSEWVSGTSELITWNSKANPAVEVKVFLFTSTGPVGEPYFTKSDVESFAFPVDPTVHDMVLKYGIRIERTDNRSIFKESERFRIIDGESSSSKNSNGSNVKNKYGSLQLFNLIIIIVAAVLFLCCGAGFLLWKYKPSMYSSLVTTKDERDSGRLPTTEIRVTPSTPSDIESQTNSVSKIDVLSGGGGGVLLGTSVLDTQQRVKYRWLIDRNDLRIDQGKVLGQGGYGVVKRGVWMDGSRQYDVAIKVLSAGSVVGNVKDELVKEADMMVSLRSPFIVQMYGMCQDSLGYLLVMELMGAGSLLGLLHTPEEDRRPSLALRVQLMQDVSRGLEYLHDKKIVHRDLKSPNILLTQEGRSLKAKIADFGLAKISQSEVGTTTAHAAMSLLWAAPEQFEDHPKISKAVDIYAFGVIMWEIVTMKLPHEGLSMGAVMRRVLSGQREDIPSTCPPPIADLMVKCWAQEAKDRPKASYVREELMNIEIRR